MGPLSFLAASEAILNFILFFYENSLLKDKTALDGTLRSAASHLGLCCLPMSHKKDTRLIRVNLITVRKTL